ncbi:BTAD domain-containing putative transcriptional regulator [Streptomyces bluensis]|uniref:BTAD domain-containing putative transcriptional regulator n=1 Tax=Streptomyces bluensis TaxID=33897 RepID=UPI001671C909|nr:BTAD domain-containing putative transcriptional regulator [Streptomyces bluensis]GGZ96906.1 hypothetical protein GCM10010344_76250 [Streptomyces bluensis]
MKFQVLGPLTVLGDSGPVALSGVKQRATLGHLLLHANEVVATSALMRALWAGEPPPTARKMLQNAVSALRGLLAAEDTEDTGGGPVLLTHAPGYLLRVDGDDLDLTTYRALADRGRADLAAGAWSSAARTLRAALDLWHGPVLADLAESGTDWPELRTLAQARSATREDLYEAELACGRHLDVLEELRTHAQREPERERLCAQLMLALYRRGGQADALDAYRRTRTALASRLGLEPGRVLRAVERAVLDHDPVLRQPDALAIMALDGEPRRPRPAAGTPVTPRPAAVAQATLIAPATPAAPVGFDTRPAPGPPAPPALPAPPRAAAFPYPAAPAGVLTEQHKQLSMLLVRTTLGKGLGSDPEDAARLSGELAVAIRDEVARHGGKVSGVLGPVTFALFGVVRTREDDAERAVRAGRAILRRLRQYGAGGPVPVHGGSAPRVAVATGTVVVTCSPDGTGAVPIVNGAVPKSCADLLETVPPGGIRVCATTRSGTERSLVYGPAGRDGASEPLGARTARTDTPPALVGRDREREQLGGALGDVARRQRPCLLTVLGEPGAGKTRLMAELARLARRSPHGYRVVTGHSSWCDRDRPLALLDRTLASAMGTTGTDDRAHDALARTVHALFGTGDRGAWLLDRLGPLLRDEPPAPADWPDLAAAWRLLLTALAAERPLLLVLEDLHTAPDPVLDLVTELADAAGPVPLLLAVTARPELLDRRPTWGGGRRDALAVTLDPLDEPSSAALLDALLTDSGGALPTDLRRDVLARVGGNPLYAVEYARELSAASTASAAGPGRPAGPPAMPRHVRQVVAAHLDTLPPLAKAVLVCASALGGVCCADGVAAVGGVDRAEAAHWLDHLERRDFLRRSRHPSATGALRYAFRHPATREAVDALVPRTVREDRRRRAEAWTESTAAQLTA